MGEPVVIRDEAAHDQVLTVSTRGVGPGATGVLLVEVGGSVVEAHLSSGGLDALARAAADARAVVRDAELTDPDPGYYVAARDEQGNIRLNCGRGTMIAGPNDSLATVSGWLANAQPWSRFAKGYAAAVDLLVAEEAAGAPAPKPPR
ncbi:hypothetical protein [Cellulosimicrobium sp. Marseille-Q4280]|uniref:hypothetical protein n=1 Tax=Cellulosimicrobium sp. Marseille-Q4280 TaxID=2937992 RepID=UPI00203AEC7B|nr:hypothetical protein [Cellulosimicrobium sp. Marseille-Q4280]